MPHTGNGRGIQRFPGGPKESVSIAGTSEGRPEQALHCLDGSKPMKALLSPTRLPRQVTASHVPFPELFLQQSVRLHPQQATVAQCAGTSRGRKGGLLRNGEPHYWRLESQRRCWGQECVAQMRKADRPKGTEPRFSLGYKHYPHFCLSSSTT